MNLYVYVHEKTEYEPMVNQLAISQTNETVNGCMK
jgi:hypothetical protein